MRQCISTLPDLDLEGSSVLVTGGTGSFGQQFARMVLETYKVRRLIVYSRDEYKQFQMAGDPFLGKHPAIRFFIGDVRDQQRLEMALRGVDIVIHAAALKHVPLAEYNPTECVKTNITGAENVVQASIRAGVKRVIALSTDKAVNPVNLYGATKLASDKIFVAANNLGEPTGTLFSVVRYGNVVGSRGSVIPFFRTLLKQGTDYLPITDPRMTRFWITLSQGVTFVLWGLKRMRGGEVFVPKIPSLRITDLATFIAPDMEQRVVGIRPGEKLHEVMITEEDNRMTYDAGDHYVIEPNFAFGGRRTSAADRGYAAVAEGFRYSSEINDEWLDQAGFDVMMNAGTS